MTELTPQRVQVAFPVTRPAEDLRPAIDVFHRFIQQGLVEGMVLDVADYRHVPDGPGVMLVGHDVDYSLTDAVFSVVRKRHGDDDLGTQVRDLLRMGLGFLEAIADDPRLDVAVDPGTVTVSVLDRRLGDPAAVGQAVLAALTPLAAELFGDAADVTVAPAEDARRAPGVRIDADEAAAGKALAALGGAQPPLQSAWDIPVEDLVQLREGNAEFTLLDVREESEYETVNLGGTLIPLANLGERLDELDRDAHVVVHCRAGRRGAKAVALLREQGFDNAWNVNGGLMAWIDRVDPTLPRY